MIHMGRLRGRAGVMAALALTILTVSGCGADSAQTADTKATETSAQAESGTVTEPGAEDQGIPNPMEEVKDVLAFESIGVHMVLPEEAGDARFFIINKEVAEAGFTIDQASYTYRASDTAEDFSGIFERFTEDTITKSYDYGDKTMEIQIKTTDSGGRLSSWEWGSTKYTLYTASKVEDDAITDLTMKLVELSQYEK